MMELILHVYHRTKALLAEHVDLEAIKSSGVMELVIKVKYDIPNRELQRFDALTRQIDGMLDALRAQKKEVL
jgi:V/A-type H+-transporting ATPase subunit A